MNESTSNAHATLTNSDMIEIGLLTLIVAIGLPLNVFSFVRIVKKCAQDRTKISSFMSLRLQLNIADLCIICLFAIPQASWLATFFVSAVVHFDLL